MRRFEITLIAAIAVGLSAASATAQTVAMAGSYGEADGMILNFPQNPPIIPCEICVGGATPTQTVGGAWTCGPGLAVNDSECGIRVQSVNALGQNIFIEKAFVGVVGFGDIATIGGSGTLPNGLNVGDPFRVPTRFMSQMRGNQVGIILNAVVVQLDTDFTLAMPGANRQKDTANPVALTRQFSAMNWSAAGNGQNNGLTGAAKASRLNANSIITTDIGLETLTMTYTAGPNEFGGTMGALLDGVGRLYLGGFLMLATFSPFQPFARTNPIGDDPLTEPNGLAERNGVGWNYTITGNQRPGRVKGMQDIGPVCAVTPPPSPVGCNEVNDFDLNGFTLATFGAATSTKHLFAWTTGTVTVHVTAIRPPNTFINTLTGMGYDTLGISNLGGPQRNVGMVAGSYTIRTFTDTEETNISIQMIGANLRFAPEAQPSLALLIGLALLGLLGRRR